MIYTNQNVLRVVTSAALRLYRELGRPGQYVQKHPDWTPSSIVSKSRSFLAECSKKGLDNIPGSDLTLCALARPWSSDILELVRSSANVDDTTHAALIATNTWCHGVDAGKQTFDEAMIHPNRRLPLLASAALSLGEAATSFLSVRQLAAHAEVICTYF